MSIYRHRQAALSKVGREEPRERRRLDRRVATPELLVLGRPAAVGSPTARLSLFSIRPSWFPCDGGRLTRSRKHLKTQFYQNPSREKAGISSRQNGIEGDDPIGGGNEGQFPFDEPSIRDARLQITVKPCRPP